MSGHDRGQPAPSRPLTRALGWLGGGVGFLAATVVILVASSPERPVWVNLLFPAAGLVYLVAGLVAWRRRPSNGIGPLLIFGALLWMAASLYNTGVPGLVAIGLIVATLPLALVIHLVLAFPSGRVPDLASRLTAGGAYVVTGVFQAPLYLFGAAMPPFDVLQVAARPDLAELGHLVQRILAFVLVAATAAIMVRRMRRAGRDRRRVLGPLVGYGIVAVVYPVDRERTGAGHRGDRPRRGAGAPAGRVPVAFASSMLRGGFARTGEIEALGAWLGAETGGRPALQQALASTLGDPSLTLVTG